NSLAIQTRNMRLRTRDGLQKKLPATRLSIVEPSEEALGHEESLSSGQLTTSGHRFSTLAIQFPQTKLTVSQPGDPLEQEADRVANQVVGGESLEHDGSAGYIEKKEIEAAAEPANVRRKATHKSDDETSPADNLDSLVNTARMTAG